MLMQIECHGNKISAIPIHSHNKEGEKANKVIKREREREREKTFSGRVINV